MKLNKGQALDAIRNRVEREVRHYTYTIDNMIKEADEALTRFAGRFAEDPCYALENATAAITAAANKYEALRARKALETATVAEVKALFVTELTYAFRIDGSTCPTTNLMATAKGIARLRLAGLRN